MYGQSFIVAALAGVAIAGSSVTSAPPASSALPSSMGNGTVITTTKVVSRFVTYCPKPTEICVNDKTYTVTKPTTLIIEDCPCTVVETSTCPPGYKPTPQPQPVPQPPNPQPQPPAPQPTGNPAPVPAPQPTKVSPVVVAGAEGRSAAYGFAAAIAGVAGLLAL